jgi:predicted metal-dependent peptidase
MTPLEEKIVVSKVSLMIRLPFFGNLVSRMKIVDASDWCTTAATDGRNFYYNIDFISDLTNKQLEFLLCHEVLHCILDHFGRTGTRNRKLANIAQDYAVNQILIDEKIGSKITKVPILQDNKYRDMAWEEIYDDLLKNSRFVTMEELLDALGDILDEHINEDTSNGVDDGNSSIEKPGFSKEELQAIRDEIKEAMLQSATAAAGNVPAGIQRLLNSFTDTKMNWKELIQLNIQSIIKSNYSFSRPCKKSQSAGVILPGLVPVETFDIAIALDMSGSIGDHDALIFLSEVKGILDQYEDYKITMWCFDTKVYNQIEITQDNSQDFYSYEIKGGGGTCYVCNYDYMKTIGLNPKKFIMFTDGYPGGSWGDESFCDTIFLIKSNTKTIAPFGETIHYENI